MGLSARVPKCQIKNSGLDQYSAEPFKQRQFGTAGVEGVNSSFSNSCVGFYVATWLPLHLVPSDWFGRPGFAPVK